MTTLSGGRYGWNHELVYSSAGETLGGEADMKLREMQGADHNGTFFNWKQRSPSRLEFIAYIDGKPEEYGVETLSADGDPGLVSALAIWLQCRFVAVTKSVRLYRLCWRSIPCIIGGRYLKCRAIARSFRRKESVLQRPVRSLRSHGRAVEVYRDLTRSCVEEHMGRLGRPHTLRLATAMVQKINFPWFHQ